MGAAFQSAKRRLDEHFVWQADGLLIFGMTAIGRATIAALQMNRELLVNARRRWIKSGWHPPKDC